VGVGVYRSAAGHQDFGSVGHMTRGLQQLDLHRWREPLAVYEKW
jgi:hypothetical protein